MNKSDVVKTLLKEQPTQAVTNTDFVEAFAPVNIALCKYWGKRDQQLNLPVTASLSMALPDTGTTTRIALTEAPHDIITLNGQAVLEDSAFAKKLVAYLALFRTSAQYHFHIDTHSQVPVAAGLASSASGFAALIKALQKLFQWQIDDTALSILARLGSGSACRSIWPGFVLWQRGERDDGMDSHGIPLETTWPELQIGLLIFQQQAKAISSRTAMQQTVATSLLYERWPSVVDRDLPALQAAITAKDFTALGIAAERNALAMHATMQSAWPPIVYAVPETLQIMQKIWQLRAEGLPVYFTQDAGPNLKLLFLEQNAAEIRRIFNIS